MSAQEGKLKIVVIGAGSVGFTRPAITNALTSPEFKNINTTISLVDVDEQKLDRIYRFSKILKDHYKSNVNFEAATDRKQALPGADYVITAVAKRRMELWKQDFYIPHSYGFNQVFGENGGPGAAFHTLRSLHQMIPVCKDMEALCPDALLINCSNPESRVCLAVSKLTRIRAVGLCHGAFVTLRAVAEILGKSSEEIEITIAGINHFHWVIKINSRNTDEDLYPLFREKMAGSKAKVHPLVLCMYETFGLFPFPVPNHIGEFIACGYEMSGPLWLYGRRIPGWDTAQDPRHNEVQEVVDGLKPLSEELVKSNPSELHIAIIADIMFDRNIRRLSVNIPNKGHAISNLPEDAIVEVSARINREGIHPIKVGALPEAIAAMCCLQISIQKLLVQAYAEKSKKLLFQALVLDPVVDNIPRAGKMMEEMLREQADCLPELK